MEFEYDSKNLLYVRIDRKRKFLATAFLRALGLSSDEDLLKTFYNFSTLTIKGEKLFWKLDENLVGTKLSKKIPTPGKPRSVLVGAGRKITQSAFAQLKKAKVKQVEIGIEDLEGAFSGTEVVDSTSGEILLEANTEVTGGVVNSLTEIGRASCRERV